MKTYEELQAKNSALVAQIEAFREAVRGVQSVPTRSGFAVNDPNPKAEFIAWAKLNHVMALTPEQCLNEIRAEAVEEAMTETYDEIRYHVGKDYANNIESIMSDYAAKVRKGGE